jgi:hypothetical protein
MGINIAQFFVGFIVISVRYKEMKAFASANLS